MKPKKITSIAIALLLAPGLLLAQDVTGMWDIEASFTLGQSEQTLAPPSDCLYSGKGISLLQTGSRVTGDVDLNLDQGLKSCPGQMTGKLVATLTGSDFKGTLDGGKALGTADVSGEITLGTKAQASAAATSSMMGMVTTTTGPATGTNGTFTGQQLPAMPTLGPVAIGVMALILFGGTALLLSRRDRASA